MSRLNINNLNNENEDGSPRISGISTFSSAHYFVPPSGTTAERPSDPGEGMIRFNTDSGHLEYYTGEFWDEVLVANNSLDGGNRGLFGGGYSPSNVNTIDYITISNLNNAIDFGDLSVARREVGACSSSIRGLFAGGANPGRLNVIDFVTISSTGNASDFGDLSLDRYAHNSGCSNSTRGVWSNGSNSASPNSTNVIDYVTIASTGNAVDFGDSTQIAFERTGTASSTRGLWGGGSGPLNVIDYVTISTTGNAQDFGDLTTSGSGHSACANSTRAIYERAGTMGFVNIASLGNANSFGTLTNTGTHKGSCSSSTRGIFGGGDPNTNVIEYIAILTTGNGLDFGDLSVARNRLSGLSNGHGGL